MQKETTWPRFRLPSLKDAILNRCVKIVSQLAILTENEFR